MQCREFIQVVDFKLLNSLSGALCVSLTAYLSVAVKLIPKK